MPFFASDQRHSLARKQIDVFGEAASVLGPLEFCQCYHLA